MNQIELSSMCVRTIVRSHNNDHVFFYVFENEECPLKEQSLLQPKVPFYTNQNVLLAYLLSKIYILGILNWPLGNIIACSFHNSTILSSRPLLWKYVVCLKKKKIFFFKIHNSVTETHILLKPKKYQIQKSQITLILHKKVIFSFRHW